MQQEQQDLSHEASRRGQGYGGFDDPIDDPFADDGRLGDEGYEEDYSLLPSPETTHTGDVPMTSCPSFPS